MDEPGGRSGFWKLLVGCAVGCGVLLLLAVAGCVGFVAWLNRPGELIDPARLTGPQSIGAAWWTLRIEDPGTEAFLDTLLQRIDENRREQSGNLPAPLRALGELGRANDARRIRASLPIVAGVVVEPGGELEGGIPRTLGYLSLEAGGNRLVFADWLMNLALGWASADPSVAYGDERIVVIGGDRNDRESGAGAFIRGSDLFLASRLSVARTAVDRLVAGDAPRSPSRLDDLLATVPADSAIHGAMLNEHGEMGRLLSALPGLQPDREPGGTGDAGDAVPGEAVPGEAPSATLLDLLDEARRVTIRGGFETDRSLLFELQFDCVEPECARLLAALSTTPGTPAPPPRSTPPPAGQANTSRTPARDEAGSPGEALAPGSATVEVTTEGVRGRVRVRIEDPGEFLGRLLTAPASASAGG